MNDNEQTKQTKNAEGEQLRSIDLLCKFEEVTEQYQRDEGGERHIMRLSDTFWVSVLYRLTGFGNMQWETAIVRVMDDNDPRKGKRGEWDTRDIMMVAGDRRKDLEGKNESEILEWYLEHSGEKIPFEMMLDALSA